MRFLIFLSLLCSFFGESHATTLQQDTIPKRGLGITFGFLNTRFYYDSTEIRETGFQQKLFNQGKKLLKSYNLDQVAMGLGGIGVAAASGLFLYTTTDAVYATLEKRESYTTAWQLPVLSLLIAGVSFLAIRGGQGGIKEIINTYNKDKGIGDATPKIEIEPAQSGVGVAIRF